MASSVHLVVPLTMTELSEGDLEAVLANPLSPSLSHLTSSLKDVDTESTQGYLPHLLSQTFSSMAQDHM